MRRAGVSLAAAAALLLTPSAVRPQPGFAYLDGAHWSVLPVVIVDATADARVLEALRAFKARWNAMRDDGGGSVLPPVDVVTAPADRCRPGLQEAAGAGGQVLVCLDATLGSAGVGGPWRVDGDGHTRLGLIKLRPATLSWVSCRLHTAVAHEMGHVMGLGHTDPGAGASSLMAAGPTPYRGACPAWFDARDQAALRALYEGHAARCAVAGHKAI